MGILPVDDYQDDKLEAYRPGQDGSLTSNITASSGKMPVGPTAKMAVLRA
jgi:hypothetical protein